MGGLLPLPGKWTVFSLTLVLLEPLGWPQREIQAEKVGKFPVLRLELR